MSEKRYLQLCIEPRSGTDGRGLATVLRRTLKLFATDWASISDMDLVGQSRTSLAIQGHDARVISVPILLDLLEEAEQVVWATIFLCKSEREATTITGSEDFVSALAKAEGLVRVVDASYYYVYGPAGLLAGLAGELPGEQKTGGANELDFPECRPPDTGRADGC